MRALLVVTLCLTGCAGVPQAPEREARELHELWLQTTARGPYVERHTRLCVRRPDGLCEADY